MNFLQYERHAAFLKHWRPLHHSGFSCQIFTNKRETRIMKVQYLIRVQGRYFSVQLFEPDMKSRAARFLHLFRTGRLLLPHNVLPRERASYARDTCRKLLSAISHDFGEEVRILKQAAAHGVTPKLELAYVCPTAGPFALGVYVQHKGERSIADMDATQVYWMMATQSPLPLIELLQRCAAAKILHLDLHLGNILMHRGDPVLIDFGVAVAEAPFSGSDRLCYLWMLHQMLDRLEAEVHTIRDGKKYVFSHCVVPGSLDEGMIAPFCELVHAAAARARVEFNHQWAHEHPHSRPPLADSQTSVYKPAKAWVQSAYSGGASPLCVGAEGSVRGLPYIAITAPMTNPVRPY